MLFLTVRKADKVIRYFFSVVRLQLRAGLIAGFGPAARHAEAEKPARNGIVTFLRASQKGAHQLYQSLVFAF